MYLIFMAESENFCRDIGCCNNYGIEKAKIIKISHGKPSYNFDLVGNMKIWQKIFAFLIDFCQKLMDFLSSSFVLRFAQNKGRWLI